MYPGWLLNLAIEEGSSSLDNTQSVFFNVNFTQSFMELVQSSEVTYKKTTTKAKQTNKIER